MASMVRSSERATSLVPATDKVKAVRDLASRRDVLSGLLAAGTCAVARPAISQESRFFDSAGVRLRYVEGAVAGVVGNGVA